MENNIKMPANYLAMSEEEMTYTEGGYFIIDDIIAFMCGYRMGQYAKAHKNAGLEQIADAGMAQTKARLGNALTAVICVADFYDTAFGALIGVLA